MQQQKSIRQRKYRKVLKMELGPGSEDVQIAVTMKNDRMGNPTSSTLIPRVTPRTVQCAATGRRREAEGKLSFSATPAQENLLYILGNVLKSITQRRDNK
jgi:hypothetical protein